MVPSFPILPLVFLLFTVSESREILVGGSVNSWKVPESSNNNTLNHWAEKTRFKIGDSLVWKYDEKKDSVLQVTKEDYDNCTTSKPINEHKDGNTKVLLDKSGPFFFISGAPGNCLKGEKLIVVVLSPNHHPPQSSGGDLTTPSQAPVAVPAPVTIPAKSVAVGLTLGPNLVAGLVTVLALVY